MLMVVINDDIVLECVCYVFVISMCELMCLVMVSMQWKSFFLVVSVISVIISVNLCMGVGFCGECRFFIVVQIMFVFVLINSSFKFSDVVFL